ncbi:MAG: acyl--CoA ligase [Bacteroidia bacterium]|nr:acyl--CoA ligase [Bacteroidia bacterium]
MNNLFFVDENSHTSFTYQYLLDYLNSANDYTPCYKNPNIGKYLLNLIKGLVSGSNIILVDNDISDNEIIKLEIEQKYFETTKIKIDINNIDLIIERVKASNSEITLFTSGTTGTPKKVIHSVESLTRNIKINNKYSDNAWAYCYNPTHMAGLQVFFQAFFNKNSLIYLFSQKRENIFIQFNKYNITNISATPTFYRLLLPFQQAFNLISKVTFGGEKTDDSLIEKMKQFFPNAKFYNIYASTEVGSLLTSKGELFSIPEQYAGKIKIVDNELQIFKSLLAKSFQLADDWYYTGDLVQIVSEVPLLFKFNGRKTEMINSGGYKINPKEIEETIIQLPEVSYVKVFAKKNSVLGNIVCAEILFENNCKLTEEQIRTFLNTKLQDFKIPRIYKFIDKVEMTNNGKSK